jgi:acetyl esterase
MNKPDLQTEALLAKEHKRNLPATQTRSIHELRTSASPYGYISNAQIKKIVDIPIVVTSGTINLRLYIPNGKGPFPVFIYLHGGGWTLGSISSGQGECREICNQANCIVVAVDYHLAPEYKFPIPFNDCYEATEWISKNIKKYNGDPNRIVIGGMSAGGNLAAAVALKARDQKNFSLAAQVLVVPAVDCNFDKESYQIYSDGFILTTPLVKWYWNNYLKNEKDKKNPYACPLQASSFENLPPALIITAEFDPIRDDSYAYEKVLKNANTPVIQTTYPSIHGLISMADRIDEGKKATKQIVDYLNEVFKNKRV